MFIYSYCIIEGYYIFVIFIFCRFVWFFEVEIYCYLKLSLCFRCLLVDVWSWFIWKVLVRNFLENVEDSGDLEICVGDLMIGEVGLFLDLVLKFWIFRGG